MRGTKQAEWLLNYLVKNWVGCKQLIGFAEWLTDKLEGIVNRV